MTLDELLKVMKDFADAWYESSINTTESLVILFDNIMRLNLSEMTLHQALILILFVPVNIGAHVHSWIFLEKTVSTSPNVALLMFVLGPICWCLIIYWWWLVLDFGIGYIFGWLLQLL